MKAVLLIDFGSTYTKLTAVDVEAETILGTAAAYTTVQTDINEGLQKGLASAQRAPSGLTRHPSRPPPALLPRPRSSNHGGRSHSLAMQGATVSFN